MTLRPNSIRRVAILPGQMQEAAELAEDVGAFLATHEVETLLGLAQDGDFVRHVQEGECDLIVALGGDGTMLRAGSLGASCQAPILGINLGHLGFLVEVRQADWRQSLERVLAGDYWLEARMRLRVELKRRSKPHGTWHALNECVAGRGRTARPVRLRAEIDGRYLTTYVADALICATATGSTAYALAAGGPILPPEMRNMLLVPVAAHMSMDRAIVLPEGASVRILVESEEDGRLHIDGEVSEPLMADDEIEVAAGELDVHFVRLQDPGYFFRNLTSHMNSKKPNFTGP